MIADPEVTIVENPRRERKPKAPPLDMSERAQAERRHEEIIEAFELAGRKLLEQKESEGWRYLLNSDGMPYENWTDYLSRAFPTTRKHLYELMKAAPIQEVVSLAGYIIPTGSAVILAKYPQEIWIPALQTVTARYGKSTESRLERVAAVLFQVFTSGHVDVGGDEIVGLDAALDLEDYEAAERHKIEPRDYLLKNIPIQVRLDAENVISVRTNVSLPPDLANRLLPGQRLHMSMWVVDKSSKEGVSSSS